MDEIDLNEPMSLPGAGLSGSRASLGPPEQLKRRTNTSDELIARVMNQEYQMLEHEVEVLKMQVLERMLSESDHRKPFKKSMAERRLSAHIAKAAKRGAWGAVAALEGQLARIQGTEEATETKVTVNARMQTATLHILSGMPQEQIDELIAKELAIASLPAPR
jgi:hypothetical protein